MSRCIYLYIFSAVTVMTATSLYNVARYKPAFLSTVYYPAYLGVDGIYDGNFFHRSCFHTYLDWIHWWMVDLRGQFLVFKIQITNRDNSVVLANKLRNFEIDIFEDDPRKLTNFPNITGHLCYNQTAPVGRGTYNFTCSEPIVGRFVRLIMRLADANYLHLCELEILVNGSSYEEINFKMKQNYKLSGTALAILIAVDQFKCLRECLLRRSSNFCTAINWRPKSGLCELFSVNPFADLSSLLTLTTGTNFYIQIQN